MSFWNSIKNKIAKRYEDWDAWYDDDDDFEYDDDEEEVDGESHAKPPKDWEQVVYSRDHVDIHDRAQRHDYVVSCLEQIAEALREIDSLTYEYNMVTAYLKDMEEIEALPLEEKAALETAAARVNAVRKEKAMTDGEKLTMPNVKFHQFSAIDGDVEEGIEKLSEAEKYQQLIKGDLKRLDNERQAYKYRRNELISTLEDCQGMAVVCTVAVVICILALMVLQFGFEMNASWGYVIAGLAAAGFYTYTFLKYREASSEYSRVIAETNRLILLQNKVKIRYVNNTNLIDYLCMKYKVESSKELVKLWRQYNEEKERRRAYRRAQIELDANEGELLHILRRYQIGDPAIWLNQTDALLERREMVEIRHNLIVRRQSLRKRMDYNKEVVAANAQNEIRDLVESYPRYASEILALVDEYDARYSAGVLDT